MTGNLKAWLDHHAYSLVSALGRFGRRPGSTLLTVGVMAVALALPLGLWLVLDNVGRFAGSARWPTSASRWTRARCCSSPATRAPARAPC